MRAKRRQLKRVTQWDGERAIKNPGLFSSVMYL
uniref:Uncharacterized protein n=1 Tax=Anguilla anguilla TaxID=7936 RepID=A0A0E9QTH0_ANGAN